MIGVLTGAGGVLGRDAAGLNVLVVGRGRDPAEDDVLGEAIADLESRHVCFVVCVVVWEDWTVGFGVLARYA